jgi:hypothetical protein
MSFQAYLDTIERKTGKSPSDLRAMAEAKGFTTGGALNPAVRAAAVVDWAKTEMGLGHGHAQAIWAMLKGIKKEGDS